MEKFLKKVKNIHKDKYDYSLTNYIKSNEKIVIICPKHGEFKQTPSHHLTGRGCKKCGYENNTVKQTYNRDIFIEKALKVHGNKYNYSLVDYKFSNIKIDIVCGEHGKFSQTPNKHLLGQGCRKCGYNKITKIPKELKEIVKECKTLVSGVYYRGKYTKYSQAFDILGCSWKEFVEHLEDNKFGFKVGQEKIDLDHIIPISSAKTVEEVYKLSYYTNFQLLPEYYNRYEKKTNKFSINHLEKWLKTQRGKTVN